MTSKIKTTSFEDCARLSLYNRSCACYHSKSIDAGGNSYEIGGVGTLGFNSMCLSHMHLHQTIWEMTPEGVYASAEVGPHFSRLT